MEVNGQLHIPTENFGLIIFKITWPRLRELEL
jgi:hypothetical protein